MSLDNFVLYLENVENVAASLVDTAENELWISEMIPE